MVALPGRLAVLITGIRGQVLRALRWARAGKVVGAAVLGISLLAACSSAQAPSCDTPVQADNPNGYGLASGDRIRIVVFRQPDLSGEFALDGEGYLALPLVGDIAAHGLTTRQLEAEIERRLVAGDLLVTPQVGVQLVTYRSFYVVGEVGAPGSYAYRSGMTMISAIALAGGFTYRADPSSVTIERGDCRFATSVDTIVAPGDVITITERFF